MASHSAPHATQLGHFGQVIELLTDPRHDWRSRKLRLQGFRDGQLAQVCSTGPAASMAPAVCGSVSGLIAVSGSALLSASLGATAVLGVFISNHPIELAYNVGARRAGRVMIPPSRAAKRFACFLGASFLIGAAVSYALDADRLGLTFALIMTVVPLVVAASGVCVPSLMFTLCFGTAAATRPSLWSGIRTSDHLPSSNDEHRRSAFDHDRSLLDPTPVATARPTVTRVEKSLQSFSGSPRSLARRSPSR